VFSTLQPADQRSSRPVQRVYDPTGSNAKELSGHVWQIRYGDMSGAQGNVYLDKVGIGELVVENQAVEAANSVSRTFTRDNANDGLVGMAFSRLNTVKPKAQKTWFDNIRPQLAQPVFTAALKRRSVGTYDFGYVDKGKYKGEINWHTITGTKGFWDFKPTGFQVGDGPVVDFNISAIADTGTSLWYMPKTVVDAYWEKVPGASFNQIQQGFVFPCAARLPDLSLIISGKPVTVAGINMNYQQISITTCFGGLQRADRMPFAIFGDTFMKGLFVVFDAPLDGPARIGFAPQPGGS
jgi:aspergillopepsin I